jgi:hypothetical protein
MIEQAPAQGLGWIITVSAPREGDGTPFMKVFYVAVPDRTNALDAVKATIALPATGVEIIAHQTMSESLLGALSMKPGDVVQW